MRLCVDLRPSRGSFLQFVLLWESTVNLRALMGGLLVGSALAFVSCGSSRENSPQQDLAQEVSAATSKNAMWYRFKFIAEYEGVSFTIDQMVVCKRSVIPGGSLGQSPDSVLIQGQPLSIAARMIDGSQVLVRVPEMCNRYRNYERLPSPDDRYPNFQGVWGYKSGWKSRGPHAVIPLVIWSDKMPKPDRIESYVSPEYFVQGQARIRNPHGSVDLWPVGKYPPNYLAVLQQKAALPRYPNPMINPALDPNGRGGGSDGRYHGVGDTYGAITIVPVVNFNQFVERYAGLAREYRQLNAAGRVAFNTGGLTLIPSKQEPKLLQVEHAFFYPKFAVYHDKGAKFHSLEAEKSFVTSKCVSEALGGLMRGVPGNSDLPYDAAEWGSDVPDRVRYRLSEGANADIRAIYFGKQARQRNCFARLGQFKSFDIVEGRLDSSRSLRGVIVYRKWYGASDGWKGQVLGEQFVASGAINPANNVHRLRILGSDVDFPLQGTKRDKSWYPVIFEEKKTGTWFAVSTVGDAFFSARGEAGEL